MSLGRLLPRTYLRSVTRADLLDTCTILRNDGVGWVTFATTRCSVDVGTQQPPSGEPSEASIASLELVEVKVPVGLGARVGDRVRHDQTSSTYVVAGTNQPQTYRMVSRLRAVRPTAATPRQVLTFFRADPNTGNYVPVQTTVVQLVLAQGQRAQPAPGAQLVDGWIFAPDGAASLAVQPGDIFDYGGQQARITYVTPASEQRREAAFTVNVGAG